MAHAEPHLCCHSWVLQTCWFEPGWSTCSCKSGKLAFHSGWNSEFTLQGLSLMMCLQPACPVHSSFSLLRCPWMPVPVSGTLPVPLVLHHGLFCRFQQPQEQPMGIQVHQGEGSSSQNRKKLHRTETWCFHQHIAWTLQWQSFCWRSIPTFLMRTISSFGGICRHCNFTFFKPHVFLLLWMVMLWHTVQNSTNTPRNLPSLWASNPHPVLPGSH